MKLAALASLAMFAFQVVEPLLPVTVRCVLDTDLPLEELRVSVEEQRERVETPAANGSVSLRDLPEGDLHLLFYRNENLLGRVALTRARLGEFIRIKVRVVEGNAILLEELRVKGVSDTLGGSVVPLPATTTAPKLASAPPSSSPVAPATTSLAAAPPSLCPAQDESVALEGTLLQILDNDSFLLERSGSRRYTIYVGSATRLLHERTRVRLGDLKAGDRLRVRGSGAAGPEGECSVGAKEIWVLR